MTALITGMGAIASVGDDVPSLFASLCEGRSGLAEARAFDLTRYRVSNAYEIDDRPVPGGDVPLRATGWLERAVTAALADAGLPPDLTDIPVVVGTTLRELRSVELSWRDGVPFDVRDLHFGGALRRAFNATQTHTVANACAASLYVLGLGLDMLDLGLADTVVVAGTDTITESTYGLLDRVYQQPPQEVRPFDKGRRGMLQGDGAVAVVLRRDDGKGDARKAHARLRGIGMNCDAIHPSAPDAATMAGAVREAHDRAGVKPDEIDLILLHGTGTPLNDQAEAEALSTVFADVATPPYVTAIKSMIGHTAGASGLHSLVCAVEALKSGTVPPTRYVEDPIEEISRFRLVRDTADRAEAKVAQVDSFGFGGLNAVAVVEKVS